MIDSGGTIGPCTHEDRDRILAAALMRYKAVISVVHSLDFQASRTAFNEPARVVMIAAAAHLRQLVGGTLEHESATTG